MELYLDHAATSPPHPEVIEVVTGALRETYGNPSSLHRKGLLAEKALDEVRKRLARLLGSDPQEIVFTGGGTEANNMAIMGIARAYGQRGKTIITSSIEHPSVLAPMKRLEDEGYTILRLSVDRTGQINLDDLREALSQETILVSLMAVNNEIGSTFPLAQVGEILSGYPRLAFHVDAIQALGKLPLSPTQIGADLMSFSAHKIGGPKGVGALYVRRRLDLPPLILGGGQEKGRRSGTENVPGILGFGQALEVLSDPSVMAGAKESLWQGISKVIPWARRNSPEVGAPHILSLTFPGLKGEVLVHALEERGIYVSTGSACSSRDPRPSHVLQALGLSPQELEGTIRISLAPGISDTEIQQAITIITETVQLLSAMLRR